MKSMVAVIFCTLALNVLADDMSPSSPITEEQLKLSTQLVSLLRVGSTYTAYVQSCITASPNDTLNAKSLYLRNPSSFGGISPQSTYWSEIEAIFVRYHSSTCGPLSQEQYEQMTALEFARLNRSEDLKAAIAFYSSPPGKRFIITNSEVNATNNIKLTQAAQEIVRQKSWAVNAEISQVVKRYREDPK